MKIQLFWQEFLTAKNLDKNISYYEAFYFDITKESANHLLKLVLDGQKKATSSSYESYSENNLPLPGMYSIVTDFDGNPFCVIETKIVYILKYKDVTFELCSKEGEDDSLSSWQKNHEHFFKLNGKEVGYEFNENMLVIFEEFEVVYKA